MEVYNLFWNLHYNYNIAVKKMRSNNLQVFKPYNRINLQDKSKDNIKEYK